MGEAIDWLLSSDLYQIEQIFSNKCSKDLKPSKKMVIAMELRRSSSFNENQSREGRPKSRDATRFLRPDDRSHSVPPDLQKEHTIAIASKDTFETLETQCMQLINGFERLSKKVQLNIDFNSFSDFYIYTALVQSYSLYQHSRYAFDIAEHNKDLSTSQREQLSLNDARLNKIKEEAYNQIFNSFDEQDKEHG